MVSPQMFVKMVASGQQQDIQVVGSDDSTAWSLGEDSDVVFFLRTTTLAADGEITDVIEGTSDHPGVAANSLIISNITDDGDILFLVSDGGTSKGLLLLDADVGEVHFPAGSVFIGNTFAQVIGHAAQITVEEASELQVLGTADEDSQLLLHRGSGNAGDPRIHFSKGRNAIGVASTIVSDGDGIGAIRWYPADGTDLATRAATFFAEVDDGSPEAGGVGMAFVWKQMPGGGTTAARETMRLAASGALSFGTAVTISSTTGDITLNPTGSLNVTLTDDDGDAFDAANSARSYYKIDTRNTGDGVSVHLFDTETTTITSAAGSSYHLVTLNGFTIDWVDGTNITTPIDGIGLNITGPTITSASSTTITQQSTLYVAAANVSDAEITVTRNLAAEIDGPLLLTSSIFAEATPTEGTAGEQLESAGAGAVVIWATASSLGKYKDIHEPLASEVGLEKMLNATPYRFNYKEQMPDGPRMLNTKDFATTYTGVLGDDFPEVMHHAGRIFSPVSAFGYTVASIQEMHKRLTKLEGKYA